MVTKRSARSAMHLPTSRVRGMGAVEHVYPHISACNTANSANIAVMASSIGASFHTA